MSNTQQRQNSLLAALPAVEWERMQPDFQEVPLRYGDLLIEAGGLLDRLYFPVLGVISTVALFENGASAEMATVGVEGVVSLGAILGTQRALGRHVVQVPGEALVLSYDNFVQWRQRIPAFNRLLLDYAQAFVIQVMQSVACNAVHPIYDRAARWLLTCDDRSGGDSFALTQQFLSEMLGVSRPMVSTIAHTFQRAGLSKRRSAASVFGLDCPVSWSGAFAV